MDISRLPINGMSTNGGHLDTDSLNGFYEQRVKMKREEVKKSVAIVMPIIHDVLSYVHKQDPRFRIEPLNGGSYYQHLKITRADEFDYNVVFDIGSLVWGKDKPKFYKWDMNRDTVVKATSQLPSPEVGFHEIELPDSSDRVREWMRRGLNEGSSCVTFDDDLIPGLVKRRFHTLVTNAVRNLGLRETVRVSKLWHSSPTTCLMISQRGHHAISVDLSPLVNGPEGFPKSFKWPHAGAAWPSRSKMNNISSIGEGSVPRKDLYWQFSYGTCEKELLDNIDEDGGCRKKSMRIMKRLQEDVWCPRKELTSFPLKIVLFWECEQYPRAEHWRPNQLANRIESMAKRFVGHLRSGNLPLFFRPDVNVLEGKESSTRLEIASRIERFLKNPNTHVVDWRNNVIVMD